VRRNTCVTCQVSWTAPRLTTLDSYGDNSGIPLRSTHYVLLTSNFSKHYMWASGHFLLLIAAFRYFVAWITFKSVSAWWYKGRSWRFSQIPSSQLSLLSQLHWCPHQLRHRLPVSLNIIFPSSCQLTSPNLRKSLGVCGIDQRPILHVFSLSSTDSSTQCCLHQASYPG